MNTIKFDAVHIHVHHDDSVLAARLAGIDAKLQALLVQVTAEGAQMTQTEDAIAALTEDVTQQASVITSVETLIAGLKEQIGTIAGQADAATAAKLNELKASLEANTTELASAVVEGTGTAPAPEV